MLGRLPQGREGLSRAQLIGMVAICSAPHRHERAGSAHSRSLVDSALGQFIVISRERPCIPYQEADHYTSPTALRAAGPLPVCGSRRLCRAARSGTNLQAAQQAIANAERVDAATSRRRRARRGAGQSWPPRSGGRRKRDGRGAAVRRRSTRGAELAAAKAGAAKAMAVNEDIKRSTATLIEEMQRKTGESR